MDMTAKTGCSGSAERTASVTAAALDSGSPVVRTIIAISWPAFDRADTYSSSKGGSSRPIWRTSPTTPRMVSQGPSGPKIWIRRPIGSPSGKYFSLIVRLITAVPAEAESASPGRPSPRRIGICIVSK
ncbi:hypothetical protein BH24GEM1_BH24GEM1_11610 [soil metagenome]